MREIRGGVFQGRFHNLLISKNNTFWAPQISRITFQVVYGSSNLIPVKSSVLCLVGHHPTRESWESKKEALWHAWKKTTPVRSVSIWKWSSMLINTWMWRDTQFFIYPCPQR